MRRSLLSAAARVLLLLLGLTAAASAETGTGIQPLYDSGNAAAEAGRHREALDFFTRGLDVLRAAGRAESPDAGLFAAGAARSLDALGDPKADDAWRLAASLLFYAVDPWPFLNAARTLVDRLSQSGAHDEAVIHTEAMLTRTAAPDADGDQRAFAIETALGVYTAAGRKADADRVVLGAASLDGDGPEIAYLRGLARIQIAGNAQREGRMTEIMPALDGALADFRLAGDRARPLLGGLLLMRGHVAIEEGFYRDGLPVLEEAIPLLAEDAGETESWVEARALYGLLLERLDRVAEGLAFADETVAALEAKMGKSSRLAAAARLERIKLLVRAGRREDAQRSLEEEDDRLGGSADQVIAGVFYECVALVEKAYGNYSGAAGAADRAIAIFAEAFPDQPEKQLSAMRVRADASVGLADLDYSERAHRELIALSEKAFPPNHPEIARDLNAFANFLKSFGRFSEAEAIQRRAVEILRVAYGPQGAKYAFGLNNLATAIMFKGRDEEAIDLLSQAIAIADRIKEMDDFRAQTRVNLASALVWAGRFPEALAVVAEADRLFSKLDRDVSRELSLLRGIEMSALSGLDRFGEAVAAGRSMLALAKVETYDDATSLVTGLVGFAWALIKSGAPAEGLGAARDAMATLQSQAVSGGGAYRDAAQVLVGAAYAAAH